MLLPFDFAGLGEQKHFVSDVSANITCCFK